MSLAKLIPDDRVPTARRPDAQEIAVIGGGLVGLATAYKLLLAGQRGVVLFEKEAGLGQHQSTHNSGVLHAGLHYKPGSLKASLAVRGIREMVSFCDEHEIAYERCGKLVVANGDGERARLRDLMGRGQANGLVGLRWLEKDGLRELEPHARGDCALHVPEEGIVDYGAVCQTLARLIQELGGEIRLGSRVNNLKARNDGWTIHANGNVEDFRFVVNCGGLHADRIAKKAGVVVDTPIIPFRGEYWLIKPERAYLVRNLIYPVPDPAFPFLGVHLTRTIHGEVEAGPNAVLALAREGYSWSRINFRDLGQALSFPGFWRFVARYPRIAGYEIARSFSRELFLRSLQRLVPELQASDLVRGPAGVRAQVMTSKGELIQDFQIARGPRAVHVLSAPSPAATASLAIGAEIARMVLTE